MSRARQRLVSCGLFVALGLAACGDDAPPAVDAGPAPDGAIPAAPGEVAPPALPVLTPCPEGWAEIDIDGLAACAPPIAAAPADAPDCSPGTARFIDSADCVSVGPACPAGDFPDPASLPAADRVVYVRSGAPESGDGTERYPYGTIGAAIRASLPGTLVVVAKGDYPEVVDVYAGVTVVGACAAETRIIPADGSAAVHLNEPNASLSGFTVAPSGPLLGVTIASTGVMLDGLVIDGATGAGLELRRGATVTATSLAVSHTRVHPTVDLCRAIALSDAELTLTRAALAKNEGDGLSVIGVSRVTATDLSVVDTGLTYETPRGFLAQDGAVIELGRGYFARYEGAIATALGEGARIAFEDVVIEDALGSSSDAAAAGIIANENAALELTRVRFERIGTYAAYPVSGSTGVLSDVVVRGVGAARDFGIAFGAGPAATLTIRRTLVADAENAALFASGTGGSGVPDGAGPTLDIEDLTIIGMNVDGSTAGYGVALGNGTQGTLRRVAIRDVRGDGVLVQEPATDVTFEDLRVATTAQQGDGLYGRALEVQYGGRAAIERGSLASNTEVTVMAYGEGASLSAHLVAIEDTRARACAETTCVDAPAGVGVGAYASARVTLDDFVIDGAPLCGAQIADGAELDLARGVIRNANVGACVQIEGYDLERVTGSVRYEDNDINVDSATREVPAPAMLDLSL